MLGSLRRTPAIAALSAATLVALTACGGGGSVKVTLTPAKVIALAKRNLDKTAGVHVTLEGKDLPGGTTSLVAADGTLTRAPAFDGTITVTLLGAHPVVPVIAVDGTVYAKLPLTVGWQTVDPAQYGVPDPATLLDPSTGISHLLTETSGLASKGSVRGGKDNKEVLTTYAGRLPGSAVAAVIPGSAGTFGVTYTIDDAHRLEEAVLTGHFYGASKSESTYTLTLDEYGVTKKITAP